MIVLWIDEEKYSRNAYRQAISGFRKLIPYNTSALLAC